MFFLILHYDGIKFSGRDDYLIEKNTNLSKNYFWEKRKVLLSFVHTSGFLT